MLNFESDKNKEVARRLKIQAQILGDMALDSIYKYRKLAHNKLFGPSTPAKLIDIDLDTRLDINYEDHDIGLVELLRYEGAFDNMPHDSQAENREQTG